MPVQVVKMYNSLIACVHYNQNQITLINTQSSSNSDTPSSAGIEKKVLGGSRGHSSYINSVDISPEGLVASTGDDRRLLLWDESGSPQNFPLDGAGKLVKFWSAPFGDVLIVLEAGNKIRLLDYNKSEWILTIYPGQAGCCGPMTGNVRSFFVNNNYLYAVGVGWWKKYDLTNVQGGCGYTQPVVEESFITKPDKFSFVVTSSLGSSGNGSSSDTTIGVASQNTQYIYDTAKEDSTKLYALNYTLSSDEIAAAAIRNEGDLLAIASGKLLTLVRNPNSKYPWVNWCLKMVCFHFIFLFKENK